MTRDKAKKVLAETWQFSRVGELVALRDVELIEAARTHEAVRSAGSSLNYYQSQPPRAS